MKVEEAVLQLIIDYLSRGENKVPIYLVETAHPVHKLSGRARLRALRGKGIVDYRYDRFNQAYEILNSIDEIITAAGAHGYFVQERKKKELKPPPVEEEISKEDIKGLLEKLEKNS